MVHLNEKHSIVTFLRAIMELSDALKCEKIWVSPVVKKANSIYLAAIWKNSLANKLLAF